MKNTIKKGKFHILIMSVGDSRYMGLCKEFGFIEEGKSLEEVEDKMNNSIILLLKTVKKHVELEGALNLGLPVKYRMLFYIVPLFVWLSVFISWFDTNVRYFTSDLSQLKHGKVFS